MAEPSLSRTRHSGSPRSKEISSRAQLKGRGATLKPRPVETRAVLIAKEGAAEGSESYSTDSEVEAAQPSKLRVSGCKYAAVRGIICGEYAASSSSNHEKPVYRKVDGKPNPQVLIYYWDSRDGAEQMGWWFGPEIGGEKVWAHNASSAQRPPPKGWRVPHDGDIDELLVEGEESSSEEVSEPRDARKGAVGVADEASPKKANSKAASKPNREDFSFSALAKRKQEERLAAEKSKKDEERAKRKEEKRKVEEERGRAEVRRQKLREKLEAKQQKAKEQQRSQKEREATRAQREEEINRQLAQVQREELEVQRAMEDLKRKAAEHATRLADLQRQLATIAKERAGETDATAPREEDSDEEEGEEEMEEDDEVVEPKTLAQKALAPKAAPRAAQPKARPKAPTGAAPKRRVRGAEPKRRAARQLPDARMQQAGSVAEDVRAASPQAEGEKPKEDAGAKASTAAGAAEEESYEESYESEEKEEAKPPVKAPEAPREKRVEIDSEEESAPKAKRSQSLHLCSREKRQRSSRPRSPRRSVRRSRSDRYRRRDERSRSDHRYGRDVRDRYHRDRRDSRRDRRDDRYTKDRRERNGNDSGASAADLAQAKEVEAALRGTLHELTSADARSKRKED